MELQADVGHPTHAESASVRGQLVVSVRSPLSIPSHTMFKRRHLTAGYITSSTSSSPRTRRPAVAADRQRHRRPNATAVVSL